VVQGTRQPQSGRQKTVWVVQQHEEITIVDSPNRPDLAVHQGERIKQAFGPFATRELAQARATELEQGTLSWLVAQGR
jgi:hypothetical protein